MLSVSNVHKTFDGVRAVDDLTFDVAKGEIFGLVGPNGAGKTTVLRMIMKILEPDSGTITLDSAQINESTKEKIGYLPEEHGLYRKSRVRDVLVYFAGLKSVDRSTARHRADYWLDRMGLGGFAARKCDELSKGMQQKIQFILTLLHEPMMLILDEPFSGLDPVNQRLFKEVISELQRKGCTILFSAHQMEQVEKLCERICMISRGKRVLYGRLDEIKEEYGSRCYRIDCDGKESLESLGLFTAVTIHAGHVDVVPREGVSGREILEKIMVLGEVRHFEAVRPSLEQIFVEKVAESSG